MRLTVPLALLSLLFSASCGRATIDLNRARLDVGLVDGAVDPGDGGPVDGPVGPDGGEPFDLGEPGDAGDPLAALVIDPQQVTLSVGSTQLFTLLLIGADGSRIDVTSQASWTTSGDVVRVSAGRVVAVTPGDALITATYRGLVAEAKVTVSPFRLVGLEVSPTNPSAALNVVVPFKAEGILEDGTRVDLTSNATWQSGDPTVASVDGQGLARTLRPGATEIAATVGMARGRSILTVTTARPVGLQIDPVDPTVGVGTSIQFTATAIFSDGTSGNVTAQATWTAGDQAVVRIDATGLARAVAQGSTDVIVDYAGLRQASRVTVSAAPLTALRIEPTRVVLAVGAPADLRAIGTYADGTTADLTGSVGWVSADPRIATVVGTGATAGRVTGVTSGTTSVRATLAGVQATASVEVTRATLTGLAIQPASTTVAVGTSAQLRAQGTYSDGTTADLTGSVTWASASPTIATVSSGGATAGTVTGVSVGTTRVTAQLSGVMAAATVTVSAAALTSIAVAPANASTEVGVRSLYTATGVFSDGTTTELTSQVTWSTADQAIATISNVSGAQGQLRARAAGSTRVTATLMGITGATTVTVTEATLSSLTVAPIAPSVSAGTPVRFTATAIFSNGTQRNVSNQVTWSSSSQVVATISGMGLATTLARGTTTIQATYMGTTGSTTLTVTDATITSISVSPAVAQVVVGGTQNFSAQAIFSDGTSRNVTQQATWRSSNSAVAQIGTGRAGASNARGLTAGTVTITASFQGLSGTATLTVTSATVVSLQITPFAPSLAVGGTQQFQVVALYSDGTSQNVTNQATWTSSAPAVAAISTGGGGPGGGGARGLATALSAGNTTITARFSGLTGTTTLTVTGATITQIQVTPFTPTRPVGFGVAMRAVAIYSDATTRDVTAQATWSSSAPSIASVNTAGPNRGQVTTIAVGTTTIRAQYQASSGTTPLTVSSATLQSIAVTPTLSSVPIRQTLQLTAVGTFSDASTLDLTDVVTWQSAATSIADVSNAVGSRGQLTAISPGTAVITATRGGVSGFMTLVVP